MVRTARFQCVNPGSIPGGTAKKIMPHIHKKIDFTAEVFVVHRDKVLLRKHDKYNMWLSVGGHIELNEDPNEAAIREVKEEVGLDVTLADDLRPFKKDTAEYHELTPPKYMNRHLVSDGHEHITLIYFGRSFTDAAVIPDGHEKSDDIKWFTREELEKNIEGIEETIRFYALRALEELKFF